MVVVVFVYLFIFLFLRLGFFCLEPNGKKVHLNENDFHQSYGNYFKKFYFGSYFVSAVFKDLSQYLRGTLTTAFQRNVPVHDFTTMTQYTC